MRASFKKRKRHLIPIIVLSIFVFLVLMVPLPDSLNIAPFKPLVEMKLSNATGMKVRISGSMGITFVPEQMVLFEKVIIENRGGTFASIDMAAIQLKFMPFLKGKAGIDNIEIFKPSIYIERYENGKLNIEPLLNKIINRKMTGRKSFEIGNITLVNGVLSYLDLQKGHDLKLDGITMSINDLEADSAFPGKMSFTGSMGIEKLSTELLTFTDLSMGINAGEGIYNIDSFKADILGGSGEGTVSINVNGDYPMVAVRSDLSSLSLETIFETFKKKQLLKGDLDLSLDIMMQANRNRESIRTVTGSFDLSGRSIVVKGMDIDEFLHKFRKTQNIGLMEIGMFLVAGPIGTAISRGVEYGGLYKAGVGEDGEIREFISSWEINDGVVTARGAAFATEKNRLALTGKIDLVNGKFEDVVVSVLDTDGCSEFMQKINGSLKDPQFENVIVKRSLFGPAISLIKKAGKFLSGGKCNPFYAGAVQHPQSTTH